ncbi:hypothetical protein MJO29_016160 [Puccinia striiformis f. sp. tritici]|uniref:Uncharacterized protein n=1 Tax=Puccinia striiformis f. sp. tritici PST-78 TaxID=1165861 RepID=A0A0L0VYN7_9BASI|nr:hypothetical protein MJO29_016160 [Puccinia striiformis f. sp. tritici]KNF04378.1 hypothetical protein PSTG_02294 [Puccinia striiformis f. sp. tritici PST-78]
MSTTRTPNHPAIVSGLFEAIQEYGLVHTSSFLQCSGLKKDKLENFQINLQTNTALTNILLPHTLNYLSGRLIALNDDTTPNLTYNHDTLATEVASDDTESGNTLEVIVTHHDWDSEVYASNLSDWRKVHIVGQIVNFEMESHLTIVLVTSVSLTSGHQPAKPIANASAGGTPSTSGGQQFTSFAGSATPTTPSLSAGKKSFTTPLSSSAVKKRNKKAKSSPLSSSETTPSKKKGKAKAIEPESSDSDGTLSASTSDKSDKEESPLPATPAKRGRPRRNVIKQAAKK